MAPMKSWVDVAFIRMADAAILIGAMCGVLLFLVVLFNTISRYVFSLSLPETEDLGGLLFAAVLFATIPYVAQRGTDIRVTLFVDRYSRRAKRWMRVVSALLVLNFACIFGIVAFEFAAVSYRVGAESAVGRIVLYPWMGVIPISMVLLGLVTVRRLFEEFSGGGDQAIISDDQPSSSP
ncbi:MAG: TRAP transporter small permease [Burkholderiales bacterium]